MLRLCRVAGGIRSRGGHLVLPAAIPQPAPWEHSPYGLWGQRTSVSLDRATPDARTLRQQGGKLPAAEAILSWAVTCAKAPGAEAPSCSRMPAAAPQGPPPSVHHFQLAPAFMKPAQAVLAQLTPSTGEKVCPPLPGEAPLHPCTISLGSLSSALPRKPFSSCQSSSRTPPQGKALGSRGHWSAPLLGPRFPSVPTLPRRRGVAVLMA